MHEPLSSPVSMVARAAFALSVLAFPVAQAQPLQTAEVQYREVDLTYAAEAVVEAVKQSTVSAQVTGRIVEVHYDVGDYVRKGQVIVRIDETEASQVVAGSEAQVAQAQAAFENARAALQRSRELAAQKFISQAALDKAEAEYRVAEAQLKAARAGASQASTTKSYTVVVAPYSGVVSARHVEVGEMATPGKPLMTGFDPRDMRVIASVPQYKVAEVRASPRAMVEIPSLNKWIEARSITVLPAADPRTHATRVRLDLPENVRDVYPGMFARAYFTVGRARKLVVPVSSVVKRSEVTGVYVVKPDGTVSFRQVRLGEPAGQGDIEVLAGVSAGERVAIDPIKAGMKTVPASS
ncbi:MAG TPA: efflux RND transporter periplasmic adaptor subunit [Burkholderiales bacterium]|nr:efflux RND transporter periplasmic adaptor subunit [Burkholderiales bacterium]